MPQSYVLQYTPPQQYVPQQYAAQSHAATRYPAPRHGYAQPYQQFYAQGGAFAAAPYACAYAPAVHPYTLDSGNRLRIVVFGQEGISSSYVVDAGGNVTLPLISTVPARGYPTQQLTQAISDRLKQG